MFTLHADPVPLRLEDTGTIRVGSTRVTLDVLLADYKNGLTPEQIVEELDTLSLADVYAVIAYYHRHRAEIEEYLEQRRSAAELLRQKIEANQPGRADLKAKLSAQMAARNGGRAPTGQ